MIPGNWSKNPLRQDNQGFKTEYGLATGPGILSVEGAIRRNLRRGPGKLRPNREIEPRYRSQYFSHIFAGGYSAGYYYLWSEILMPTAPPKQAGHLGSELRADFAGYMGRWSDLRMVCPVRSQY